MKFQHGDRVIVDKKESWCDGCVGTVECGWEVTKENNCYLVRLDKSPNPYIQSTYVYEDALKKYEGESR